MREQDVPVELGDVAVCLAAKVAHVVGGGLEKAKT